MTRLPRGCASPLILTVTDARLGQRFETTVSSALGDIRGQVIVGFGLQDPQTLLPGGCMVRVATLWALDLTPPRLRWTMTVPSTPSLVGTSFYTQAVLVPGPSQISDGFRVRVQR